MAVIDKEIQILMLKGEKGDRGDAGDYETLENKPSINGVLLIGNKTASDMALAAESDLNAAINSISANTTNIASNTANIGDISTLNTTNKSSLTAAINEVNVKVIPISKGGTGATNLASAKVALEIPKSVPIYSSPNGTQSTINFPPGVLSADCDYLEIFFKNGENDHASTKIVTKSLTSWPILGTLSASRAAFSEVGIYFNVASISIYNDRIDWEITRTAGIVASSVVAANTNNNLKIVRVTGAKGNGVN